MKRYLHLMAVLFVSCGFAFGQGLNDGLVAYYPFNGNANDASGNNRHLSTQGQPTFEEGINGLLSAQFNDNADGFEITGQDTPENIGAASVSVWFEQDDPSGSQVVVGLTRARTSRFIIYLENGLINYQHGMERGGRLEGGIFENQPTLSNGWNNFVLTTSGNGGKISGYLNGQFLGDVSAGINLTGLTDYMMGAYTELAPADQYRQAFRGSIQNLRIYNRALNEQEVSELYDFEKPKPSLDDGLVAYYPFNGNASDESGNGNVTEIVGATLTTGKDGSPNQAYLFDGVDDFIKCSIGAHEEVSVSLWYRSDEIHQAGDRPQVRQPYPTIFRYGGQPGSPYVTVGLGEGPWGQNLRSYLDIRPRVYDQVNTLGPLEQGVWRHAVVIKSASELTLYLDGELIDSIASTALLTGSDLYLGSSSIQTNAQNTDFLGAIDELRVYNRSLTAAEIAELSGSPAGPIEDGLVAYYPFNGNASDESGNRNVTEIVGATLTTGKDGSPNQAYLFDGVDDFIKCSIGAHEEVSVSLWYRSDEIHQAGDRPQVRQPYPTIFRYGGQPGSPYVTVGLGEGPWGQNLRSYLDIRPRVYDQVNTLGPLEQGVWRHAVVIKSASELTLYLDGELIDSVASTALLTGSDLYLGSSSIQTNAQNTDFLGAIDELRVYNRSLTAAEIAELSGYPTSKLTVLNLVNGSVTGGGTFNLGAEATLTATPSAGYVFVGWNGDASGNVNPLTVTMNANKSIGATFTIDTRDLDGDGLSNYQELVVLNTNPNNPDSDGDGYNDGQEQSEGTDPNDAGSFPNPNPNPIPLRIEKLNVPGLVIFAYWTGEAGTSYRLEYSADYQNWNILDSGIVSEGVEQSRFLPAPKGLVRIVEER